MIKRNAHFNPDQAIVEKFEGLVNGMGLVPMQITRTDFAPFPKGQVAGFDPVQAARLFLRDEAVPVDARGQPTAIDKPVVEGPKPDAPKLVEIPVNWEDLHHLQVIRLAKQVAGKPDNLTAEEARGVIAAELDRRKELENASEPNAA